MNSNLERLQKKLQIDEHGLEIALRDLPTLIEEVGQAYVLSISERDEAKQELDEIEAIVDSEIRSEAVANDEKVTEKDVDSQKKLDKRVKAANKKFLDLKLESAQWGVLKEAFEKRSYALSKLVDLYISNYYSDIEKKGNGDFKTVQSHRVKKELSERRKRVDPGE